MQNDTELTLQAITVDQNKLLLTVDNLIEDTAFISLGYADYAEIHIFNEAKLPVCPFKTTV